MLIADWLVGRSFKVRLELEERHQSAVNTEINTVREQAEQITARKGRLYESVKDARKAIEPSSHILDKGELLKALGIGNETLLFLYRSGYNDTETDQYVIEELKRQKLYYAATAFMIAPSAERVEEVEEIQRITDQCGDLTWMVQGFL